MIEQKDIEHYCRKNHHQLSHSDWCAICQYYQLSESFMREFADYIEWYHVCKYQKMSEEFMREFPQKLWIMEVMKYQKITPTLADWLVAIDESDEYRMSSIRNLLKSKNIIYDNDLKRFRKADNNEINT